MKRPRGKERIIVALDVPDLDRAGNLVKELAQHVGMFKVGLYLITSVGLPQIMAWFKKQGCDAGQVFVDNKLHDIPHTIGTAARKISEFSVGMLNVHASSGLDGMIEAVENSKSVRPDTGGPEQYRDTLVLAVTVLTSHEENAAHLIFGSPTKAKVLEFALWAKLAGCDGIICSPQELAILRAQSVLKDMLLVTPGVRPEYAAAGDQKRIMTPGEAVKAGADYLVIGRPIINPPNNIGSPMEAAQLIAEEIEKAEQEMAKKKDED
ncbi:MAG: orotidine-5'-phosphate decarboxylase [Candidatus Parcubacteria bacterium]|nr:orotidine-5'-phosphate decarboxylase [Candidatus Parcubacteria bacterium]